MKEHVIKTVGIGGSGANIVNHLLNKGIEISELSAIDTDKNLLNKLPSNIKTLLIGENITQGNGTNCKYDQGLLSAYSGKNEIIKFLIDSRVILLVSGLGGGTGSGSLPIVVSTSKELNIFTIGVFTIPFQWEGKRRLDNANHSIEESVKYFNCLFIVRSDDVLKSSKENIEFRDSFIRINNYLYDLISWILLSIKKSPELFI